MADQSMSLEETNKVRISLGLAPLVDDDGDKAAGANTDSAGVQDDDPDSIAEANWAERRAADKRAREEKEAKERLQKARNQRELRAKLEGKGLGTADDGDGDDTGKASDWIKKQRKAAKLRAIELEKLKAREKELEERDREALRYGEDDLAGLKVGHGVADFQEGEDVILTLKDGRVLEDGDDELQNINLAEYARTADRLDLKKRGKTAYKYTGFDDDEFDAFQQGKERGVLSKYDEVLGESSKSGNEGFRLGELSGGGTSSSTATSRPSTSKLGGLQSEEEKQKQIRRELLSLDYTKAEQTDYLQEGDVGFKKPKKKKKRTEKTISSRRLPTFDDDGNEGAVPSSSNGHARDTDMNMNGEGEEEEEKKPKLPTAERRLAKEGFELDGGVIDDDDMQAALARQRRAANKQRLKIMKGEDLARQLLEEQKAREESRAGSMPVDSATAGQNGDANNDDNDMLEVKKEEDVEDEDEDNAGLVLDDTSEFIRNISSRPVIAKREHATSRGANGSATPLGNGTSSRLPRVKSEPREDGDVPLDEMDVKEEEPEEGEAVSDEEMEGAHFKRETSTLSEGGRARSTSRLSKSVEPEHGKEEEEAWGSTATEKHHSGGLANTLALLKSSGEVKALTPEERERERAYKERERFLRELKKAEMEAEAEKARNRQTGNNKDQAQREYENKQRAYNMAQKQIEAFKNYKPNVEINYTDEFGRDLTPKEAWKHLSHKFHGKGSGTNKREKLLKKIEDERKREAMSAGDTPLGTNAAFKARQERTGSATMILGVGNRNAAPSADALLGSSAGKAALDVSKNKNAPGTSGTNKRKRTEPKVLG